jgi:hypothetical protein
VSELAATLRETLAVLAAGDPGCNRFGAAHHRYLLAPPYVCRDPAVPDDLRELARELGGGGAGPYYGWFVVESALEHVTAAPSGPSLGWSRALPVAHLGCGYAAVVPLDGTARGEVWLDARAARVMRPLHVSFTAFYLDWIDRLARGGLPDGHLSPFACALPNALGAYLADWEAAHDVAPGTLAGEELKRALAELGPGAIEIGAEPPLFLRGERADPCVACARMLANLGLPLAVVAPGHTPLPVRHEIVDALS